MEGQHRILGPSKSAASTPIEATNNDPAVAIISIKSSLTFHNNFNYVPVIPDLLYVSDRTTGQDASTFTVYKGGYALDSNNNGYANHDITKSVVQTITNPTGVSLTGATVVATVIIGDKGSQSINLGELGIVLHAGETLVVTGKTVGGNSYLSASLTWREDH